MRSSVQANVFYFIDHMVNVSRLLVERQGQLSQMAKLDCNAMVWRTYWRITFFILYYLRLASTIA